MKTEKELQRIGKYITKLLRHDPEDLSMDKNGYVSVVELSHKLTITKDDLDCIVSSDNKNRFSYNINQTKIRCNQGHSLDVDVELQEKEPPEFLYHGSSSKSINSIMREGIKPMSRKFVHLSDNIDTAINVGNRHSKGVDSSTAVLKISSKDMFDLGYVFYLSVNGVWLCDFVPSKYIDVDSYER